MGQLGDSVDGGWAAEILDRLEKLEADNRSLRAQLGSLRHRNQAPGARADGSGPTPVVSVPPGQDSAPAAPSRRLLLGGALAGAAAVIGATAGARPAAATAGAMQFGAVNNAGTDSTTLTSTSTAHTLMATSNAGDALHGSSPYGRAIVGTADKGTGVYGSAGPGTAVYGFSLKGIGVMAHTDTGTALSVKAREAGAVAGARIETTSAPALEIWAGRAHLRLQATSDVLEPTKDAVPRQRGDIVRDGAGNLWLCTLSGTPGTWRKLGGPTGAGTFHVLPAPVRVYDSRPSTLPAVGSKTKLVANVARTLDCTVNNSGVPADATAVMTTVLLINAFNGNGNFTLWANGTAVPAANTMVWGAGSGRYTANAVSALDATGRVQARASAPTDLVLDIVGYYR